MKKPLYIYGAGGLGREVMAMLHDIDGCELQGFIDDGIAKERFVKGIPVIGGIDSLRGLTDVSIVLAIGSPLLKKKIAAMLPPGVECPALIHPRATLMNKNSIAIGKGAIICAGAVLTSDISIGEHVLINLNATVGHDTSIGSYSSVMPGVNVAGEVSVGECVLLGAGCNIRNRTRIGGESQVGMGAAVIRDVVEGETVVGVPAQSSKKK